ncbi:MAG: ribonuclease III [Clostridiales bacterium]|jgi:ribonuclease-3|nr:ribonuclease III [Clostridiales bacterium]
MEKGNGLTEAEKKIKHTFSNGELLRTAFTHSSENSAGNNERLEFVGDSILNFVIADYLTRNFDFDEGNMTERRKTLVNTKILAKVIEENKLDDYLITAKNLTHSPRMKASLFEAITAAVYYDAGIDAAYDFIIRFLKKYIKNEEKDYKSLLNEQAVKKFKEYPKYTSEEKKDGNAKFFVSTVAVNGQILGDGQGISKKEAEHMAARKALLSWE